MKSATILVVEDESIVARDLQSRLMNMGYAVPAIFASAEDALQKAGLINPDLALMDIRLKGEMDGVEAAEQLRDVYDVPCVYLTAYTDGDTLRRARITEPYGYIVKPFEERELQITIEAALHRHNLERKLKQKEQWLFAIMSSIQDGIIIVSRDGTVVFMNPAAERITGWSEKDAVCSDVRLVLKPPEAAVDPDPVTELLEKGADAAVLEKRFNLVDKAGAESVVHCRALPMQDDKKNLTGVAVVLRDAAGLA